MRAISEEVDLTIRNGHHVQLITWVRFHNIYHAKKMHIRILMRKSEPLILVSIYLWLSFNFNY